MLQLQIGLPGGRYHAASMADPRQPEWPPHPSRVYSALVAAAYVGGRQPSPTERALLQRLEAAPPPALSYPDADLRSAPDSFVPVNDEKSRIEAKRGQSHGVLLPSRQARQFPSAFLLADPEITLTWDLDLNADDVHVLDRLASRMTHLGTSHSLVTARCINEAPLRPPRLVPAQGGTHFLRVALPGRLDELDQLASRGHGTLRRPPPRFEVLLPYSEGAPSADDVVPTRHDWVTVRLFDVTWGADTANTLARAVRRAVLSIAGDDAPAVLHGHDLDIDHVAWLPLPDVGHIHARGRIRGLAMALPLSASATDRAMAMAALARLQEVRLPDGQVARAVASIEGPDTPIVLRTSTWLGPSTHWSTATPVLLDRPPKRATPGAILDALAESLVNAGHPTPIAISVSRTSDFEGAPGALEVPTRIPRFHARVVFAQPVCGPVLAGRWRRFGIGVFRPTPVELRT